MSEKRVKKERSDIILEWKEFRLGKDPLIESLRKKIKEDTKLSETN